MHEACCGAWRWPGSHMHLPARSHSTNDMRYDSITHVHHSEQTGMPHAPALPTEKLASAAAPSCSTPTCSCDNFLHAACPISTGCGTRHVHLVRGGGGDKPRSVAHQDRLNTARAPGTRAEA